MKTLLLILGAPLWLPLLIAAAAVLLSLYLSLWAIVIALWAVFASAAALAIFGIAYGAHLAFLSSIPVALAYVGAGGALLGVAILMFFLCRTTSDVIRFPIKRLSLRLERRRYRV